MLHLYKIINWLPHSQSRIVSLCLFCMANLMVSMALSIVNIALPTMLQSLNATFAQIQWLTLGYILSTTCSLVIAGRLSDIYGRKQLFVIGVLLFTLCSAFAAMTQSLWLIIGLRLLQGLGSGTIVVTTMAAISDITPPNKVAKSMALLASMSALGTGLGPVIGGMLIELSQWQSIFLLNVPLGLMVLYLAQKYLPSGQCISTARFENYVGAVFLLITIITYACGIKLLENGLTILNSSLLTLSFISLLAFVYLELLHKPTLLSLATMQLSLHGLAFLANLIVSTVVITSVIIGPFYLTLALKLTLYQTGLVMGVSPATVVVVTAIVGPISGRLHLKTLMLSGLVILTFGTYNMTQLVIASGISGYILNLIISAIGYALFLYSNNTVAMLAAPPDNRGAISGVLNLARNLGLLTGTSLMSNLFAAQAQINNLSITQPAKVETGLHAAYTAATIMLVILISIQLATAIKAQK